MATPPATAARFTVYGAQCALRLNVIVPGVMLGLRCEALINDEWSYVKEVSFTPEEISTKADTDAVFQKCLDEINVSLEEALGGGNPSEEPESGEERIQWLLDNRLKVVDNKLTML